MTPEDRAHFEQALGLARRAGRAAAPNPRVGCVIVRQGEVVGEGWHRRPGEPHAEIVALRQAGDAARGSDLYVTLEPCAHLGRTPPCADAILEAGVSRVVVGMIDPDPLVRGRGVARLEQGGVRVEVAEGEPAAAARNELEDYLVHRREGRAFVVAKSATTLDGRIADRRGGSRWITSEVARRHGRGLRDLYGAIVVGVGTVVRDDPVLLPPTGPDAGPFHRCVVDPRLRTPPECRLLAEGAWSPLVVYVGQEADIGRRIALEKAGAEVVTLSGDAHMGGLAPLEILRDLSRRGVLGAVVEGGGGALGRFLAAGLIDKWLWYVAPKVLGDPEAFAAVQGGERRLSDAWQGRIAGVDVLGDDMLITVYPNPTRSDG